MARRERKDAEIIHFSSANFADERENVLLPSAGLMNANANQSSSAMKPDSVTSREECRRIARGGRWDAEKFGMKAPKFEENSKSK